MYNSLAEFGAYVRRSGRASRCGGGTAGRRAARFPAVGRHQLNGRRVIPVGACRSLPAEARARGDVDGCGGGCRFGVVRLPGGGRRSLYLGWPGNAGSGRAFPMCGVGPVRVRLVCDGYLARKGLP